MKISILTFSKEFNYGANLQCYALCKTLHNLGHEVVIIDAQLQKIKSSFISKIIRIPEQFYFERFRKRFFSFTRRYSNYNELIKMPPNSDAYIVGSDQVWNPEITKRFHPEAYFFPFVSNDKIKISYAASFGMEKWIGTKWDDNIRSYIKNFNAISVRELGGKFICNETFGVEAEVVLDPTLLLNSYDEICGQYHKCYDTKELVYFKFVRDNLCETICRDIAKKYGLTPVYLGNKRFVKGFKFRPIVSIDKWLNSIRYADFIVADSFHSLAFCIIFNKQFISLPSFKGRSGRMQDLLSLLNLTERFCTDSEDLRKRAHILYNNRINYDEVNKKLNWLRKISLNFIITHLK